MVTAQFGAIADDVSGAIELASMLSRAGAAVTLRLGSPEGAAATPCEVVALRIRTAPIGEAVAQARQALKWLTARGADRIFWTYGGDIEAIARGNVGPVTDALMSDLRAEMALHCPAAPAAGVRVFMSHLFRDEDAGDGMGEEGARVAPRETHLGRLMSAQVLRPVGRVTFPTVRAGAGAIRAALACRSGHVIADAVEEADLVTIAGVARDHALACGGAALGTLLRPLPQAVGEGAHHAVPPMPVAGPGRLVLAGSCDLVTRTQIGLYLDRALGYRLDPVELAETGAGPARAWLAQQDPEADKVIYSSAEPNALAETRATLGSGRAATLVRDALGQLAVDARALRIGRIAVAGTGTALAIARSLGIDRLRMGEEIVPGLPWGLAEDGLALAIKPGSFGAPDLLTSIFGMATPGDVLAAQ